jgi:glycosyltransferase involved in cell wall biosynthesis/SAM-dependent methyltransferase
MRSDEILKLVQGPKVLDIGCAGHAVKPDHPGWLHGRLREHFDVTGIDISDRNIALMKSMGIQDVHVQSADNFELGRLYNTIVAGEVVEHLSNPGRFLATARRHLLPGGRLVLSTPYGFSLMYAAYAANHFPKTCENAEHTCWFCPTTLGELARREGFEVEQWRLIDDYEPSVRSFKYQLYLEIAPSDWMDAVRPDHEDHHAYGPDMPILAQSDNSLAPAEGSPQLHSLLLAHNYYQQPGGEDRAFANEAELLERNGHTVVRYVDRNARIHAGNIQLGLNTIWSRESHAGLRSAADGRQLDLAHFHNTFPLVSPSAYYAARNMGLAVVQTLHNYRLLCPAATFLRNSSICEDCLESRSLLPALKHGCYKESRGATSAVAAMLTVHRAMGTWQRMVDVYIALSEFARRKFIEGGIPKDRIVVKPNFLDGDPGVGDASGGYALFVGRLSEEKGLRVLARAWHALQGIPLMVAGDGPLQWIEWPAGVTLLGHQPRERVLDLMRGARVLVLPSIWYECAPVTVVEALACGLPVIASDLGSLPEFVIHRENGLLFRPGDAEDLARQVRWACDHPQEFWAMRAAARREYEQKYTAERNYTMLMDIYAMAIENARRRLPAAS